MYAAIGEPIYHKFLKKDYTGFLPLVVNECNENFYVLQVVGQFKNEILYHFKKEGSLLSNHNLGPARLTLSVILNNDGILFFN